MAAAVASCQLSWQLWWVSVAVVAIVAVVVTVTRAAVVVAVAVAVAVLVAVVVMVTAIGVGGGVGCWGGQCRGDGGDGGDGGGSHGHGCVVRRWRWLLQGWLLWRWQVLWPPRSRLWRE
jgi:hypothetical protein